MVLRPIGSVDRVSRSHVRLGRSRSCICDTVPGLLQVFEHDQPLVHDLSFAHGFPPCIFDHVEGRGFDPADGGCAFVKLVARLTSTSTGRVESADYVPQSLEVSLERSYVVAHLGMELVNGSRRNGSRRGSNRDGGRSGNCRNNGRRRSVACRMNWVSLLMKRPVPGRGQLPAFTSLQWLCG